MFRRNRNAGHNAQVCQATVSEFAKAAQVADAAAAGGDPTKVAEAREARAMLEGERAACMLEARMKRKEMTYASRATRMGSKAEINAKKQEIAQARYATKMQRLEYRKAKQEAGMDGPGTKTKAVGYLALAAGAAAFFLL